MKSAVPALISIFSICALVEGATGQFYQQGSAAINGPIALSADGNTAIVVQQPPAVFVRSNGVWIPQGGIPTGLTGNESLSGPAAFSADGSTLVIGDTGDNGGVGAALIFVKSNGVWTRQAKLVGSGSTVPDQVGYAVAISADGNTVAVGGNFSPGVWVFTRANGVWTQQGGILTGMGSGPSYYQGNAVGLSGDGNTLLISDPSANNQIGQVWVFTRSNGVWTRQGNLSPTDPSGTSAVGTSIALSNDGKTAIVGGAGDNQNTGAAWVFVNTNGAWTQQGPKLVGSGSIGQSQQGQAVAISADGNTAIVGGPFDNNLPGAVWVFRRSNSTWSQLGDKIAGGAIGSSVAISADGNTFATRGSSATFYAISATPPAVTLSPSIAYIGTSGGLGSFAASFNPPAASWTVSSNANWLTVISPPSGTGNTNVGYSAAANGSVSPRTGTITVNGQPFSLVQSGTPPAYSISVTPTGIPAAGGTGTVTVTATPSDAPWTVTSSASWITFTSPVSGAGNGTVTFSAAPNSFVAREAVLSAGGMTTIVSQAGMSAINDYSTAQSSTGDIVTGPDGALWFTGLPGAIGRITTAGVVTQFSLSVPGLATQRITAGPDGRLWFTAVSTGSPNLGFIGSISTTGQSALYPLPSNAIPGGITAGPDGALWFIEIGAKIGRITTNGNITEYPLPANTSGFSSATGITSGPDGALWFIAQNYVGRMTTSGTLTQYPLGLNGYSTAIVAGPDGAMWFNISQGTPFTRGCQETAVGRITTVGQVTMVSIPNLHSTSSGCSVGGGITTGPDGALWATDTTSAILQISTGGIVTGIFPANGAAAITTGPDGRIWFTESGGIGQLPGSTPPSGLAFYPLTPCRVVDTRGANGPFGEPSLAANSVRDIPMMSSPFCGIPLGAQAYSLNVTVVPPGPLTFLTVFPSGQSRPLASTLNSYDGATVANAAIVPAGTNGDLSIYASDATDVIIDINGYFAPQSNQGLAFYPATPCRVADTRGGQSLAGGQTRSFQVSGACNVPASAQAFSLNLTAIPPGPLLYLSAWAANQTQPIVSTLNSDGRIVANAAIVPAGANGAINVFASNPTDLAIDIDGYFAPPGGPGALYYFPVTPCRVADTRVGQSLAANSTRSFAMTSTCGLPATAQAYSLNFTVVPPGPQLYLTTWPQGAAQPYVSTLNSPLGRPVANAAIVPAGANGGISVFVTDPTDLIIDTNGYFSHP